MLTDSHGALLVAATAATAAAAAHTFLNANHAFSAQSESQLTIQAGDVLKLIDGSHADWWQVEVVGGAGRQGFVPASYVSPHAQPQQVAAEADEGDDDNTELLVHCASDTLAPAPVPAPASAVFSAPAPVPEPEGEEEEEWQPSESWGNLLGSDSGEVDPATAAADPFAEAQV